MNKESIMILCISVTLSALLIYNALLSFFTFAYGQKQPNIPTTISTKPLPVILIQGYNENSTIWSEWETLLRNAGIPFFAVTFHKSDDECGSATNHSKELAQIVKDVERNTGHNQVNIVGHSKGGLDARVYLKNSSNTNVANLIMLGTPNGGAPLASPFDPCAPAVDDFVDHAPATLAGRNLHTNYYTIAGIWNPSLPLNCPQPDRQQEVQGYLTLSSIEYLLNDGGIPLSSVQSQGYFRSLGNTTDCHSNLMSDKEYRYAQPILKGS